MVRNKYKIFRNLAQYNKKKDPPKDSKEHENEKNKFEKYFKENI